MKTIKKGCQLCLILFVILMLTACTDDQAETRNFTILLSNNANNKRYDFSQDLYSDLYESCLKNDTRVNLISMDGNPHLITTLTCEKPKSGYSATKKEELATKNATYIIRTMDEYVQNQDQTDFIKGINVSSTYIDQSALDNSLYIYNNGLSTEGSLCMTDTIIDSYNQDSIVSHLVESEVLPDLSGYQTVMLKIGQGDGTNQEEITNKEKNILKELYKSILKKCNVSNPIIEDTAVLNESYDSDAHVSIIPVIKDSNAIEDINDGSIISLNEESIGFVSNSAQFIDKNKAMDSVEIIFQKMQSSTFELLIVGCTAKTYDDTNAIILSQQRSNAVASLLYEKGISQDRITTLGVGSESVFYKENIVNGQFDEEIAKENRRVVFLDKNSSLAKSLLKDFQGGKNNDEF